MAPLPLNELLAQAKDFDLKLLFWEGEESRTIDHVFAAHTDPGPVSILALVGPEGGFSEQEVDEAVTAGFTPVSLGSRILRAETASLTVTAILQYLSGNLDR